MLFDVGMKQSHFLRRSATSDGLDHCGLNHAFDRSSLNVDLTLQSFPIAGSSEHRGIVPQGESLLHGDGVVSNGRHLISRGQSKASMNGSGNVRNRKR